MTGVTLADAKAAKRRAARERAGNGADYGLPSERATPPDAPTPDDDIEPADPGRVDHEARRQTRLAHPSFDVDRLPKPLVECGCGDCADAVDPLAGESETWRDVLYAQDACPDPRPMTVERAREAYLVYQQAAYDTPDRTSALERTRAQHGQLFGAERDIFERFDDPTQIFLSLRLSPIGQSGRWLPPVKLDMRLHDSWANVRGVLDYRLREYSSEYAAITATTVSAATPHRHVLIYVDDPDDEVSVGVARAAVESHVENTKGAFPDDHPVESGVRDAGMVLHDPPKADEIPEETWLRVADQRGETRVPVTTATMQYVANQRPHWALAPFCEDGADGTADPSSTLLDGGLIAWAATHDWLSSSEGFDAA